MQEMHLSLSIFDGSLKSMACIGHCIALENATQKAVSELGFDLKIEHITDFSQIASYGVMSTPALVFKGKVVSYGKVLSVEEIKSILKQAQN